MSLVRGGCDRLLTPLHRRTAARCCGSPKQDVAALHFPTRYKSPPGMASLTRRYIPPRRTAAKSCGSPTQNLAALLRKILRLSYAKSCGSPTQNLAALLRKILRLSYPSTHPLIYSNLTSACSCSINGCDRLIDSVGRSPVAADALVEASNHCTH